METRDELPILWDVQSRFPLPHVLFVQILPTPGGGRVPGTNRRLYSYVSFWRVVHGFARSLDLRAFFGEFAGVHDGVRVGPAQ